MRHSIIVSLIIALVMPLYTLASAPRVVADIAPVHSLVSQVMEGIATPGLLIPAQASPHEYSFKPSEAKALSEAQIVFWIGESLTPRLEKSLKTLAGDAKKVELLEVEGIQTYGFREGATFEAHVHHGEHSDGHSDEHHDYDDKGHDDKDHDKKAHDHDKEHHEHEKKHHDHDEDKHDHHKAERAHHDHDSGHKGHDHHGDDPHAWLDPVNAEIWLREISRVLSEFDPANADTYASNTVKASARLDKLIASAQSELSEFSELNFIVFHDAYQYFERRFGLSASGAISLGDAEDPSPARIREIQAKVTELGITCAFTEPQYNPGLIKAVFGSTKTIKMGVIDPLGASIPEGAGHYEKLILQMVDSIKSCK